MKKILVIEDEEAVRMNIVELLEIEGYAVAEAENGRIGLRLAQTESPDLIISDVNMPELDGYGVLTALRQHPKTAAIPFIFLTARVEKADVRQGMRLGADDYLTKPFSLTELLNAVSSRLERHEVIRQTLDTKLQELRANISMALPHELRTPLIGILGFAKVMKTDYQALQAAEMAEMAEYIYLSAEQLHRLIENYLFYVQLEIIITDPQKIMLLRNSISASTQDTISSAIFTKASTAGRSRDVVSAFEDVPLSIAQEHLSKLILELVDNALKFSTPGSQVSISSASNNSTYTLTLTNGGRGMTKEQIESLGAYMQFDRARHEQQGSGLGLAIAKRLVEIYKGTLTIESIPDEKTTVTLSLPIAEL